MVEIASTQFERDAIQWYDLYKTYHRVASWGQFKRELLSRFGPLEYKNINGQLAKIRRTFTLDMLQEENESILEKVCFSKSEEYFDVLCGIELLCLTLSSSCELQKRDVKKPRPGQESLRNRKEAALRQRESAKEEAVAAVEQLRQAESDARALRSMTQRMILSEEEMVCILNIASMLDGVCDSPCDNRITSVCVFHIYRKRLS
ncbi:hypothetical protein B296_00027955 [Ensete ventricosum]|uniref:Retrotransposon gag domain-containing protein n=1 Tax=Ensete ventricosum TaxID=4639 RepID=A0A426XTX7_ENSVE|nr:hypothetical protein B296_00027955 [Ensete ventricosum]